MANLKHENYITRVKNRLGTRKEQVGAGLILLPFIITVFSDPISFVINNVFKLWSPSTNNLAIGIVLLPILIGVIIMNQDLKISKLHKLTKIAWSTAVLCVAFMMFTLAMVIPKS